MFMYVHLQYEMVNLQTTHPRVAKVHQNNPKSSTIEVCTIYPSFSIGFSEFSPAFVRFLVGFPPIICFPRPGKVEILYDKLEHLDGNCGRWLQ